MGAALTGVALQSPRIEFEVEKPQRLRFAGKLDDGVMDGEVTGAGKTRPFHLTRITNLNVGVFAGIYRVGKDHVITVRPTYETGLNGLALIDFKTAESRALFPWMARRFSAATNFWSRIPSTPRFSLEAKCPARCTSPGSAPVLR